ncbi:MAG: hypothetical protein Q9174_005095, partial [Haloplaca sp. 1 TL-2023]
MAIPKALQVKTAQMSFELREDMESIPKHTLTRLDTAKQLAGEENVIDITFDHNIQISQQLSDDVGCTLRLTPQEYGAVTVDITGSRKYQAPTLTLQGDEKEALELPLAKYGSKMSQIRLKLTGPIKNKGGTKAPNDKVLAGQLKALMTGVERHNIDRYVLKAESRDQRKKLPALQDCKIKTRASPSGLSVIVEAYPTTSGPTTFDTEDMDMDDGLTPGQAYWLDAPKLFPTDVDTMRKHPIIGGPKNAWQVVVDKETATSTAYLVGTITNSFADGGIAAFVNKEEESVTLEPDFNDVTAERGRKAIKQTEDEVDELSRKLTGFFRPTNAAKAPGTTLPVSAMFAGQPYTASINNIEGPQAQLPPSITEGLTPKQLEGLNNWLRFRVALIQGPPGTGKSFVASGAVQYTCDETEGQAAGVAVSISFFDAVVPAYLIKDLLFKLRVLVYTILQVEVAYWWTTPDVAVDRLLESCVKRWNKTHPDKCAPFVRVYSETHIRKTFASREFQSLRAPNHLEELRYQLALVDAGAYPNYLRGRQEQEEFGRITDEKLFKAYAKEAKVLARQVLESSRAVFCTTASVLSSLLYETDSDGALIWYYKATTIINDEAATTTRPQFLQLLMAFPSAIRLLLIGDPRQLPAFKLSKEAKDLWVKCEMGSMMEKGFPCVMLDIQYRTHDRLYCHTPVVIYEKPISSTRLTREPNTFVEEYLSTPIRVIAEDGADYKLTQFLHFLDVPHGQQIKKQHGSSSNLAE